MPRCLSALLPPRAIERWMLRVCSPSLTVLLIETLLPEIATHTVQIGFSSAALPRATQNAGGALNCNASLSLQCASCCLVLLVPCRHIPMKIIALEARRCQAPCGGNASFLLNSSCRGFSIPRATQQLTNAKGGDRRWLRGCPLPGCSRGAVLAPRLQSVRGPGIAVEGGSLSGFAAARARLVGGGLRARPLGNQVAGVCGFARKAV